MLLDCVQLLTRAWTAAYTAGLDPNEGLSRCDEVASDLYEHAACARVSGTSELAIASQVAGRLGRGVLADIAWRLERGRLGEVAVKTGGAAPMPWLTTAFLISAALALSGLAVAQAYLGDAYIWRVAVGSGGTAGMFLGLYLSSWRAMVGALLCAAGSIAIAAAFTFVPPLALLAPAFGLASVRRAWRLEILRATS
jgi:hypothetical protein